MESLPLELPEPAAFLPERRPSVYDSGVKRRHERDTRGGREWADEGSYVCGSCGEEIVVPLDPSAGEHQHYVEDCPVCCVPNEVYVDFDEDGSARVSSRTE